MRKLACFGLFALWAPIAASAQDMPPGHPPLEPPADPGEPDAPPAGDPDPHGGGPHAGMDVESLFRPPNVASAEPASDVPAGTIRVEVVDQFGVVVPDAEVELGTMSGGRAAARRASRTDASGVSLYEDLVRGSGTAYRVYVNHEGARYASDPIVLMPEIGHVVRIRRLPVTHDERQVLQFVAQTIVEIRDDRLHVVVQAQLVNAGDATYVFPPGGTRIQLPPGFLAFNSPAAMNEIDITEVEDFGVSFGGSLPPGMVTTAYAFDVPYSAGLGLSDSGGESEVVIANPFRTMRYRIITDAPQGLSLDADDFPAPQRFESDGRQLLGTELMRRPGDPPLEEIRFTLRGLPGPGPTRWFATFGALGVLVVGFVLGRRDRDGSAARRRLREALEAREQELLDRAAQVRADRDAGEIGPETCQSELDALVHQLASVLARKDKLGSDGAAAVRAAVARPAVERPAVSTVSSPAESAPKKKAKSVGRSPKTKAGRPARGKSPESGQA